MTQRRLVCTEDDYDIVRILVTEDESKPKDDRFQVWVERLWDTGEISLFPSFTDFMKWLEDEKDYERHEFTCDRDEINFVLGGIDFRNEEPRRGCRCKTCRRLRREYAKTKSI